MGCVYFLIFLIWMFSFFIISVIPIKKIFLWPIHCNFFQNIIHWTRKVKKWSRQSWQYYYAQLFLKVHWPSLLHKCPQINHFCNYVQLPQKNRRKYHIVAFHPYISKCDDQICFYSRRSRRVSKERPKTATLPHPQVLDETLKDKVTLTIALWVKQNKHVFSQGSSPSFHIISI